MTETRTFAYRLPGGEVRHETRRQDQENPVYAILASRDDGGWGLYRMTQNDDEVLRCIKELFSKGQDVLVTKPWAVTENSEKDV